MAGKMTAYRREFSRTFEVFFFKPKLSVFFLN